MTHTAAICTRCLAGVGLLAALLTACSASVDGTDVVRSDVPRYDAVTIDGALRHLESFPIVATGAAAACVTLDACGRAESLLTASGLTINRCIHDYHVFQAIGLAVQVDYRSNAMWPVARDDVRAALDCADHGGACGTVMRCLFWSAAPDCTPAGYTFGCWGSHRIRCDGLENGLPSNALAWFSSCARLGGECAIDGQCVGRRIPKPCYDDRVCAGGTMTVTLYQPCRAFTIVCSEFFAEMSCGVPFPESPRRLECLLPGPWCAPTLDDIAESCDGDRLQRCVQMVDESLSGFGNTFALDCRRLFRGTCAADLPTDESGDRRPVCTYGPDAECHARSPSFCIGDWVIACDRGRYVRVDCRARGLGPCRQGRCERGPL